MINSVSKRGSILEQPNRSRRVVQFGVFEAELQARELRKNGIKLHLQDQPFHVLAILLEHPGEIVTREELRKRVWPADTFVDFDNSLNAAINKIREVLAEAGQTCHDLGMAARRNRSWTFLRPWCGTWTSHC